MYQIINVCEAGEDPHPDVVALLERLYDSSSRYSGYVIGDYQTRLAQLRQFPRCELLCYTSGNVVSYAAALVHEYDGNVGWCISISMAAGDPDFASMMCSRHAIRLAIEMAKQVGAEYISYSHTVHRLEYRVKYMEIKHVKSYQAGEVHRPA